jgi:hypothetical protein
MEPTKSQKGDAAVLLVAAKLTFAGVVVLRPESDSLPFDLGIYFNKKLFRLQIKKARLLNSGRWEIPVRHTVVKTTGAISKKYSSEEVDFIVGVVMETGDIYFISMNQIEKIKVSIQIDPKRVSKSKALNRKVDPELCKNLIILDGAVLRI